MIPYDEIPAGRRDILDRTARLSEDGLGVLGAALAQWAVRDDTKAEPEATRAGHTAIGAIDSMLRELHQLRARLVSEVREHQDIGDARADALLAHGTDS
jgi:hypothetical protein